MDAIEKRARELLAAEYVKEGRMVSAKETMFGNDLQAHAEYIALRAIIAALLLGRPVDLLDQYGASRIEAHELQVVPSAALGTDKAGAVGVDQVARGLPRDIELAEIAPEEVASEHLAGLLPKGDGEATAAHFGEEGLKRGAASHHQARPRAAQANHQGEGACE